MYRLPILSANAPTRKGTHVRAQISYNLSSLSSCTTRHESSRNLLIGVKKQISEDIIFVLPLTKEDIQSTSHQRTNGSLPWTHAIGRKEQLQVGAEL